jgi:hypothetical protein
MNFQSYDFQKRFSKFCLFSQVISNLFFTFSNLSRNVIKFFIIFLDEFDEKLTEFNLCFM